MRTKLSASLFVSLGVLLLAGSAFAHHGFAGRYDEEHPTTVSGTVVELQFFNPHSIIVFDVKDAKGATVRWQAELGSANIMARTDGWTRTTLKPGDKVTITGPANKNGMGDMNLSHESKITMTDTGKVVHDSIKADQTGGQAVTPAQ